MTNEKLQELYAQWDTYHKKTASVKRRRKITRYFIYVAVAAGAFYFYGVVPGLLVLILIAVTEPKRT